MRLSGVKPGDLLRVGEDLHVEVLEPPARQRVRVRMLGRPAVRTVRACDVTAHYRKAKTACSRPTK